MWRGFAGDLPPCHLVWQGLTKQMRGISCWRTTPVNDDVEAGEAVFGRHLAHLPSTTEHGGGYSLILSPKSGAMASFQCIRK